MNTVLPLQRKNKQQVYFHLSSLLLFLFITVFHIEISSAQSCVKGYHLLYQGKVHADPENIPNVSFSSSDFMYFKWKSQKHRKRYKDQKVTHGSVWVTPNAIRIDSILVGYEMITDGEPPYLLKAKEMINSFEVIRQSGTKIVHIEGGDLPYKTPENKDHPAKITHLKYDEDSDITSTGIYKKPEHAISSSAVSAYMFFSKMKELSVNLKNTTKKKHGFDIYKDIDDSSTSYLKINNNIFAMQYQPNFNGLKGSQRLANIKNVCLTEEDFFIPKALLEESYINAERFNSSFYKN